jgi:multidrug efflux pump subunit AcrA (membrane-fusion protein)
MKKHLVAGVVVAAVAVVVGAWLVARARTDSVAPATPGAAGAPAISVTTVHVQKRDVDVVLEATGTVQSINSVDVRPQISSVITKVHIKEGQFVRAGDPLFTLDARNDEVNVAKAQAQLAKDQPALAHPERQLARSQDLFKQNFI